MSPLLRRIDRAWIHYCPGCDGIHVIPDYANGPRWVFNDQYDRPGFWPSVKHNWGSFQDQRAPKVCHYFISEGRIEYCGDSTHLLAGQTVDLPPIPGDLA